MTRRGALIVLEGIDGAGKSAVARALAARWRRRRWPVVRRREPSDPRLGRAAVDRAAADPWGAAMLFSLDRALAAPKVEAELRAGRVVLQDRSYYSTWAYQAAEGGADAARIRELQPGLAHRPDRVVLLDLAPEVALRRVRRRGRGRTRLERLGRLRKVRRAYRALARRPGWTVVDADAPLPVVVGRVDAALAPWIARRRGGR